MDWLQYLKLDETLSMSQRKTLARKRAKSAKRNSKKLANARKRSSKRRERVVSHSDIAARAKKQAIVSMKKKLTDRFAGGMSWDQVPDTVVVKLNKWKTGPKFQRSVRRNIKELKGELRDNKAKMKDALQFVRDSLELTDNISELNSIRIKGNSIVVTFRNNYLKDNQLDKDWFDQFEVEADRINLETDMKKSVIKNDNNFIIWSFK
tara:strand:+ start:563 stop:1183 length:621 start_codon:yes stop_codon:yes gene_type:complete